MTIQRRRFLSMATAAAVMPALPQFARAQAYPARPVRLIVGFAAGGATDIAARLIGKYLSDRLGQPFVIENRVGAGGNIATEAVTRAAPDGYTLLMAGLNDAVNATLYEKLSFNFIRDIAPVATVIQQPLVMVVHPSVPAKTVPEFIAYAKQNSGKINMASPGTGTPPHLAGELFKMKTGIDMLHVPYRGGAPAVTDLLAGRVQVIFISELLSLPHIKAGTLRAIAETSTTRSPALPDIPTVSEFIPGFEASFWTGIGTPHNTPTEAVEILNKEINAALKDADMKKRFAEIGGIGMGGTPAQFKQFLVDETEKWRAVIKFAKIKTL
jgi:tripartite-type tricarboxylate transporter receptor subunit TctC